MAYAIVTAIYAQCACDSDRDRHRSKAHICSMLEQPLLDLENQAAVAAAAVTLSDSY
jgi:hypothetical protein